MADSAGTAGMVHPDPALLGIYLNDHFAAGTAGEQLFRRATAALKGSPAGAALERMADEVAQDRSTLRETMASLGVPVRRYKVYAAWLTEKGGRLKPNGRLRSRSPLSTVLELEAMLSGVHAKAALWRTLRALTPSEGRLDARRLDGLLDRARQQAETLEELRASAAAEVFRRP